MFRSAPSSPFDLNTGCGQRRHGGNDEIVVGGYLGVVPDVFPDLPEFLETVTPKVFGSRMDENKKQFLHAFFMVDFGNQQVTFAGSS